uniref:Uncharacterized protein n=3 Tax=Avena sativa TaxID=4498 RepID=A0ACD5WZM3_AVESA
MYDQMSYSRGSRQSSYSRYRSRSRSVDSSDVENPGNNLYVTGLSSRITDRDLEKHFSTEGEVIDASIVLDPWTRESRGFGFVTMATLKDAERCIKYLTVRCWKVESLLLRRQREDEVETQLLEDILALNHRVDGGIPQACHLLGETVTAHATRLSGSVLILPTTEGDRTLDMTGGVPTLLMAEGDHTLPPTGHTLLTKGADPTHPTTGADHTLPTTGVGHTTHLAMVIATVRDLHTVTEGGGHIPMTVLFHPTTAGTILQGEKDAAILAVCHRAGATHAAARQYQKNQGAVLQGKDTTKKTIHRAAGRLARGVLGKAMLTAAARTPGLSLGSAPAQLAPDGFRQCRHLISLQPLDLQCYVICTLCLSMPWTTIFCLNSGPTSHVYY